ncbi:MAG: IPExxxVDY family protein [Chitinophagaceae bacterium]|nr:MAG: IPExxxVDY family protein [Chitinophagaceae bacterium]
MAQMKLVLDHREMTDSFFEDTRLLGIMAPIKDYSFCWHINQAMGVDFRINNEIEIQLKRKNRDYFFTVFEYTQPNTSLTHYLYNNQYDGEYLLPEFRHLDFLWLFKGDPVSDDEMDTVMQTIRGIKSVQLVVEMTNEQIKNKEHLVF